MTLLQRRAVGLIGLMTALCGAVAVAVWQENSSVARLERKEAAQKLFAATSLTDVKSVALTTPQQTLTLEHRGTGDDGWRLITPLAVLAEGTTVESMVKAAVDLRTTGRVGGAGPDDDGTHPAATPADLSLFGLAPPRYTLTLTDPNGQSQTLLVGKKNAFDGSLYVKRADQTEVALVPSAFAYQLDQDLYKLRDKRPFTFDNNAVKTLEVTPRHGTAYRIERRGADAFALTAPLQAAADEAFVSVLLTSLTSMRASHFVAEDASKVDLGHYGLADPTVRATLTLQDGTQVALSLGDIAVAGTTHFFAYRPDAPTTPVFEVASDWPSKKLGIDPLELRDMHVTRFERDAVQAVKVQDPANALAFSKKHNDKDNVDSWEPKGMADTKVQSAKVAALVYQVWNLKAEHIVSDAPKPHELTAHGLDTAGLHIELATADGQLLGGLVLGHEDGDNRFATDSNRTHIFTVAKSATQAFTTRLAAYQEEAGVAASN